jgi:hypothetical protein
MSGMPESETMIHSITQDQPAVGILRKPFVLDELIAAVAKALGGQSQAR